MKQGRMKMGLVMLNGPESCALKNRKTLRSRKAAAPGSAALRWEPQLQGQRPENVPPAPITSRFISHCLFPAPLPPPSIFPAQLFSDGCRSRGRGRGADRIRSGEVRGAQEGLRRMAVTFDPPGDTRQGHTRVPAVQSWSPVVVPEHHPGSLTSRLNPRLLPAGRRRLNVGPPPSG